MYFRFYAVGTDVHVTGFATTSIVYAYETKIVCCF